MKTFSDIVSLFVRFFKLGCFTFGGGWGMISQMQEAFVEKEQCMTGEELLDLVSVSRSLPGTMIGNLAVLFGYRRAKAWGSIACVVGLTLPPLLLLSAITLFYSSFRDNYWIAAAMSGIRAAVVPIIFSAAVVLMKAVFRKKSGIVIAMLALVAYLAGVGCVGIVAGGAVCGLLIKVIERRKGHEG